MHRYALIALYASSKTLMRTRITYIQLHAKERHSKGMLTNGHCKLNVSIRNIIRIL